MASRRIVLSLAAALAPPLGALGLQVSAKRELSLFSLSLNSGTNFPLFYFFCFILYTVILKKSRAGCVLNYFAMFALCEEIALHKLFFVKISNKSFKTFNYFHSS